MIHSVDEVLPYQWRLAEHLAAPIKDYSKPFGRAAWADMGLGKTISALLAMQKLEDNLELGKTLIIAPRRVSLRTWQDEIAGWPHIKLTHSSVIGTPKKRLEALEENANLYIIGRDNWTWLTNQYREKGKNWKGGMKWPFNTIVMDEAHTFKNRDSERWGAANRIRRHPRTLRPVAERVLQLTGSPADNTLLHLWAQVYLMDWGERLGTGIEAYRDRWFKLAPSGYGYVPHEWAREQILQQVRDIAFVLREEDYLDLPEIKMNPVKVYLTDTERKVYRTLQRQKIVEWLDARRGTNSKVKAAAPGSLYAKLLQLSAGAVYDENREVLHLHDHKVKALLELADGAAGMLVFYWYQHSLPRIEECFKKHKINYRVIRTPADEDDWNNRKFDIGIMQPASAGYGLNLQRGGDIVTWFDLTANLELWKQANARLFGGHRRKGKNPVLNFLVADGTIDERVLMALEHRGEQETYLKEQLKQVIKEAMDA